MVLNPVLIIVLITVFKLNNVKYAVTFCNNPMNCFFSKLWLTIVMLVVIGFSLCMAGIPTFSEMLTCAQ